MYEVGLATWRRGRFIRLQLLLISALEESLIKKKKKKKKQTTPKKTPTPNNKNQNQPKNPDFLIYRSLWKVYTGYQLRIIKD